MLLTVDGQSDRLFHRTLLLKTLPRPPGHVGCGKASWAPGPFAQHSALCIAGLLRASTACVRPPSATLLPPCPRLGPARTPRSARTGRVAGAGPPARLELLGVSRRLGSARSPRLILRLQSPLT